MAGFNVSGLPGYGTEHFAPGRSGFVAWKPFGLKHRFALSRSG